MKVSDGVTSRYRFYPSPSLPQQASRHLQDEGGATNDRHDKSILYAIAGKSYALRIDSLVSQARANLQGVEGQAPIFLYEVPKESSSKANQIQWWLHLPRQGDWSPST